MVLGTWYWLVRHTETICVLLRCDMRSEDIWDHKILLSHVSWGIYTSGIHWVTWGTVTPKDICCLLWIDKARSTDKTYIYYESIKWELKTKPIWVSVVYYESIKRELNKRFTFDCRCDARLKGKAEGHTRLPYTRLVFNTFMNCLLWIVKARAKDKKDIWISVRWKAN